MARSIRAERRTRRRAAQVRASGAEKRTVESGRTSRLRRRCLEWRRRCRYAGRRRDARYAEELKGLDLVVDGYRHVSSVERTFVCFRQFVWESNQHERGGKPGGTASERKLIDRSLHTKALRLRRLPGWDWHVTSDVKCAYRRAPGVVYARSLRFCETDDGRTAEEATSRLRRMQPRLTSSCILCRRPSSQSRVASPWSRAASNGPRSVSHCRHPSQPIVSPSKTSAMRTSTSTSVPSVESGSRSSSTNAHT